MDRRSLTRRSSSHALAGLAAVLASAALAPTAHADVTVAGSRMLGRTAADSVIADAAAASGKALRLQSTATVRATLTLPRAATSIVLRVRGIACAGTPAVRVAVDGQAVATRTVSGTPYRTLTAARTIAAGSHQLGIALMAAHRAKGCRRALVVDTVRTVTPVVASPPPATTLTTTGAPASALPALVVPPVLGTPAPPAPATPTAPNTPPAPPTTTPEPEPTPPAPEPEPTPPAPEPTPEPTPPTEPAPPAAPKLRWAAPALTSPTTIAVAQGDRSYALDTSKDYILDLGASKHLGAVGITGGRNVVIEGGAIGLPADSSKATALAIKSNVGTVHVEGVWFDGSAHEMDAIQISAPSSTVQVENVRATGLRGSMSTNHTDIIQPWGGVAKLRVDRLSADSNYQGIFTRPDQGAIGSVDLENVDLKFNDAAATSSGGFLLWMSTDCSMAPTTLTNVYITPRSGTSVGGAVWPPTTDGMCPSKLTNNTVTFPNLPVTGGVTGGAPPGGSYVPADAAGLGYVSPGYR